MTPARILVVDNEPDVEALITQKFRSQVRKGEMDFLFAHDGKHALSLERSKVRKPADCRR